MNKLMNLKCLCVIMFCRITSAFRSFAITKFPVRTSRSLVFLKGDNDSIDELLGSVLRRAFNTLEAKENASNPIENGDIKTSMDTPKPVETVDNLFGSAVRRAVNTLETVPGEMKSSPLEEGKTTRRNMREGVDGLLESVVKRSVDTLETRGEEIGSSAPPDDGKITIGENDGEKDLLGSAVKRAGSTLETQRYIQSNPSENDDAKIPPLGSYNENPCIKFTALAHKQWQHVLVPGIDAAIDATCGNGNDSRILASILFPDKDIDTSSELICIDVQKDACLATENAVLEVVGPNVFDEKVQIMQTSHASLPVTTSPLGLVCWNLGYLPNSSDKVICTQLESTIASITSAALSVRVGGLLSIMTYPKTNTNEHHAVFALLECLALLSSKDMKYSDFLASLDSDSCLDQTNIDLKKVKKIVTEAIDRVVKDGVKNQTWRVMEHKMMGQPLAPILLTAIRIK